jgi:hypothetical protein
MLGSRISLLAQSAESRAAGLVRHDSGTYCGSVQARIDFDNLYAVRSQILMFQVSTDAAPRSHFFEDSVLLSELSQRASPRGMKSDRGT